MRNRSVPKKNFTQQFGENEQHEKYEKLKREFDELTLQYQALKFDSDQQRELLKNQEQYVNELYTEQVRLKTLIEYAPVGIIVVDEKGNFLVTNQEADSTVGGKVTGDAYSPNGSYSLHYPDGSLIPQKELPMVQALEKGEIIRDYEMLVRGIDGQNRHLLVSAAPVRNSHPESYGTIAVLQDVTKRKQAEEALKENEARFRALISASAQALYSMSPDWSEMRQLIGGSFLVNTEKPNRNWLQEYIHPDDQPWVLTVIENAVETGTVFDLEHRVLCANGTLGWTASRAVPVRNADGEIIEWFGAASNITDRKMAEQATRESEERFRQLADAMPQLVWTARADGVLDYCNHRYMEYTGIALRADHTLDWLNAIHPDDLQATLESWQKAVEQGEVYQIEHRVKMKDGVYRWHLSRGVPVCSESGQVLKWYGTSTDIHVQKDVEENLRLSERRLRRLVDANIIAIMYRSEDGKVLEANDAYLELTGYSRQELEEGRINCFNLTPKEFHSIDIQAIQETRTSGSCQPYEKDYLRKDGSRLPVLIGFAQLDPSEQAQVAFVLNLSRLKQVEAELQEQSQMLEKSNKELENFAYIASHDLQEPLHKITAFGKRLVEKIPAELDEEGKDYLRRMIDASRRMQDMIEALLMLSRVNTHGDDFIPVDLEEVTSTVISDLESRIGTAGGEVSFDGFAIIKADPVQMHQLLQNLIGNALKYHKPETAPRVNISVEPVQKEVGSLSDAVRISVSDNGIGFDEQYLERIFQPFHRLVGRSEFEGSGIGLAICKKIVERHNGSITARSRPGQGSTFIVTLPYGT